MFNVAKKNKLIKKEPEVAASGSERKIDTIDGIQITPTSVLYHLCIRLKSAYETSKWIWQRLQAVR